MISKLTIRLSSKKLIFIGIVGFLLLSAGVYIGFKVVPNVIMDKIWDIKILKENTQQWDMFMKVPFPFTFKVYIFDVKNPDEILQGEVPIVEQAGPYVYKAYRWNSEVEWNSTDTISYYSYMRFEFDREASGKRTEEDSVTILNTPYNSMILTVEATQPSALPMIDDVSSAIFGENDGLFITVKVKDYLFDGLKMCENLGKPGFASTMVCKQIVAKMKEAKNMRMVNNTILFSTLHYKNNTHLGRFTIKSGIDDRENTGHLKLYDGQSYITAWLEEKSLCNKIRGITTIFPPNIQKNMLFESYAEDVCRVMGLEYEREETVKGIPGYRFIARNDSFEASKEENYCFCINKSRTLDGGFGCLKDGLVDLTTCTGAPVLMSFPHLLYADQGYLSSVKGLHPNRAEHETFVILEPISGVPLQLSRKIQLNMFIRPLEGIASMENVSHALIPIMWIEESTVLGDEYTDMLKNTLFRTMKIFSVVKWVVIGIGLALITLSFFLFVYMKAP
nr:sensory neurons membrane protein [Semanotus bifasciatus]